MEGYNNNITASLKNQVEVYMENNMTQLWDRVDKLEERVRLVENQQAGTIIYIKEIKEDLHEIKTDIKKIQPSDITPKTSFWQTPSGIFVIRTLCIIGFAITAAAIGINYFKEYLEVMVK